MADVSWMLNPQAMQYARLCKRLVKERAGINIRLSDPAFLAKVRGYSDELKFEPLSQGYKKLMSFSNLRENEAEYVIFGNKRYPKKKDGLSFKGVYRGRPRYD